ncbi:endonuclease [Phyllobacterium phragmitis]|uniref:Endonuclease n=1 Tax=Phyllobacterium phragmitis TaxID=2670329 RepID=A0A2S9IPM9_9HYPH|nr:endonuclease [Phyllobacterium phragmitis]
MIDTVVQERRIKGWSRARKEALFALTHEKLTALLERSKAR